MPIIACSTPSLLQVFALCRENGGIVVVEARRSCRTRPRVPRLGWRAPVQATCRRRGRFETFSFPCSDASFVLSMPMKTLLMFASTIGSHQLGIFGQVERRLGEKGERITVGLVASSATSVNSFLIVSLVADEVVVDDEGDFHPLGAALRVRRIIWLAVFSAGRRPKVTMMSQNSHWNGQPRENWMLPKR